MSKPVIEPRILKGFRDYLPQQSVERNQMIDQLRAVFSSFAYVPIDTPALEYTDILLGKGSTETDKQLYRFLDNGQRDVALRFDLTVPLARFAAMHIAELGIPFRRYHIAPVWRAEKPQRGRYREFIQCDFDIIGTESIVADAEIILIAYTAMQALGIKCLMRINNRLVLNALLESLGIAEKSSAVLRAMDKLEKLGITKVTEELQSEALLNKEDIAKVLDFIEISKYSASNSDCLDRLQTLLQKTSSSLTGITQLEELCRYLSACGLTSEDYRLDLSIARGLDYYTGTVFETTLLDLPQIGSICSGGRYNDLANLYTKQKLPGVGASVGLDRLLGALEELGRLENAKPAADILLCITEADSESRCLAFSKALRELGLKVEIYPQLSKLAAQLKYADRKKLPFVAWGSIEDISAGFCNVKKLDSGEQQEKISAKQVAAWILNTEVP